MSSRNPSISNQIILIPELLTEKVESVPHAARFFNFLAYELDLQLYKTQNLGTPPYDRPTLLAVILYAMYKGHFESDGIVKFAEDSIGAQWILNGMNMPSYKTVERTINCIISEMDSIFIQILRLCEEQGLIGGECCYIDGVKVKANASKHKAMSYKYMGEKIIKRKDDLNVLFKELRAILDDNEDLTDTEIEKVFLEDAASIHNNLQKIHQKALTIRQEQIFNKDYKETSDQEQAEFEKAAVEEIKNKSDIIKRIDPAKQDEAFDMLNDIAHIHKRIDRMEDAKEELENKWKAENGSKKIPDNQQINFTDSDSGIMVTKHHGVQQCYNNFAIVDNKANIILGVYTSSSPSDQVSLIPCIERTENLYGRLENMQLGSDAGFFSANNIGYCIKNGIDFYASYPEAKSHYAKDKFIYNENADMYTCPGGKTLTMEKQLKNGDICLYSNEDACRNCTHRNDCAKAKDGVRRIERNMIDDKLRENAKEKANSEIGREILRLRKTVPEPVWGNIKTQDDFTQMHYRGIEKAGYEFELHCVVQNIRKLLKVYMKSKSYQDIVHGKCGGCFKTA